MGFWVSLLKVSTAIGDGCKFLNDNATQVASCYWLFEGDVEFIHEKVDYMNLGEGIVPSLGGLSKIELIDIVLDNFDVSQKDVEFLEHLKAEARRVL